MGQRLGKDYNNSLRDSIRALGKPDIEQLLKHNKCEVNGIEIYPEDLVLNKQVLERVQTQTLKGIAKDEYAVLVDFEQDQQIKDAYVIREFVNKVQKFRKELELSIDDDIQIYYSTHDKDLD